MQTIKFKINSITCPACVTLSINALKEIPGILDAQVDLMSGLAKVQTERAVSWAEISDSLRKIKKEATLIND